MHRQFLDLADCIGVESCLELIPDDDARIKIWFRDGGADERRGIFVRKEPTTRDEGRRRTAEREYPPPLPSLARTENLPPHMPWVFKRYHTSDGRLVIKEEKVRHHEYFKAHRANGRLTLQLVPLDGGIAGAVEKEGEEDEETGENVEVGYDDEGEQEVGEDQMIVAEEGVNKKLPALSVESNGEAVLGGGGGAGGSGGGGGKPTSKCYDLLGRMTSYGILFPAVNPVHI